jgi:recombination protein RecT
MANNQVSINLAKNPVSDIVKLCKSPAMMTRFGRVLGDKAGQFLAGVSSAVTVNAELLKADPNSVMAAALVAATLNLDVIPGLGLAALIPYYDGNAKKTKCQFQIMTRGIVQLALRSGQYTAINSTEIYEDEFDEYNPLTGDFKLKSVKNGFRDRGIADKVIGYASYFRLLNGYQHVEFWTNSRILLHAERYSKSYAKYHNGLWLDNFPAMASKTVLKNNLSKWGPLSVEMQKAIVVDQKIYSSLSADDNEDTGFYLDNPASDEEAIDSDIAQPPAVQTATAQAPQSARASQPKKRAGTFNTPAHAPASVGRVDVMNDNPEATEPEPDQQDEGYRPLEGFDESDLPF